MQTPRSRSAHVHLRVMAPASALVLVLTLGAPGYAADGRAPEAKALLAEIARSQKDPDRAGLSEAMERLPGTHNALKDPSLRKKLQKAAGKTLTDKRGGEWRRAAALALGRLDDAKGAYAQLGKAIPSPKDQEASPAQLDAIRATATLSPVPEAAIAPLTNLLRKGKSLPAIEQAALALGAYGKSRKRVAILKEVLGAMSRHAASAESAARKKPKKGASDRAWKLLEAPLVKAANQLTGQKYESGSEWMQAYEANKKKPGALFLDATD